jgi:hypothetical protein
MPKYSQTEIELWISRANKTLYKLGTKSTDERFFEEDNSFEDEKVLIYVLKKAITWLYISPSVNEKDLAALVSLLISRISIYDFGKAVPMYNTGTTTFVGLPSGDGEGGGGGEDGTVPDDVRLVGGEDLSPGITSFTDIRITVGYRYRVIRNSLYFFDWYNTGTSIYLTGVGDFVVAGDVFVIQHY